MKGVNVTGDLKKEGRWAESVAYEKNENRKFNQKRKMKL